MNVKCVGHQGDVVIFEVDEFPQGERKQDELTKNYQLALGELSGHNHYFPNGANAVDLFKIDDKKYEGLSFFECKEDTDLVHGRIVGFKGKEADQDYHNVTTIKKGKYVTGIVEETDWIMRTIRRVAD